MDSIVRDFATHLYDIGLLSSGSMRDYVSIFNSEAEAALDCFNDYISEYMIRDLLSKSLIILLSNLSEEGINLLSLNVLSKYAETKSKERLSKMLSVYKIYSRRSTGRKNNKLFLAFSRWHKLSEISRDMSSMYLTKSQSLETSLMKREREELQHCTFVPRINSISKQIDHPHNVYQRLFTDHERNISRKLIRVIENDKKESELVSFTPDMTLTSGKIGLNNSSFLTRQDQYNTKRNISKEKILKDVEDDFDQKYTFTPSILKTLPGKFVKSIESSSPAHQRLYEGYFKRERTINHLRKKSEGRMRSLSNKSLERVDLSPIKQRVDPKVIENLYNDHKKNQNKKHELRRVFDKEDGICFKPKLLSNNAKYSPKMNFIDRNNKLIENKKNFVDIYNQLYDENMNMQKLGGRVPPNEYEEIRKNVVDRLYSQGLEKMLRKGQISTPQNKNHFEKNLRKNDNLDNLSTHSINSKRSNNKNLPLKKDISMPQSNYTFGKEKKPAYNFDEEFGACHIETVKQLD